ncbi:MAG: methylmalonyl-CoA carboxyltransferase [Clostridiales bacterium]|jgi:acetyl-CoA carboxylase carboxyltransferase component|nr:methylmalonyl-CoA carboxyltransferase [Clostridiales bacterium]
MSLTSDRIAALRQKRNTLLEGGGPERIEKQRAAGKDTARGRLDALFDAGTFVEVDAYVESRAVEFGMAKKRLPGDGVVVGYGSVNGRLVFASSQDFTVIGGSLGEMHAKKITKAMDMAVKMGAPFISLNDSGGARIEEGLDALFGYGEIFTRNTHASGVIPQISVILGPCAGGAVYSPAITDFIFIVEKTGNMFITGPQVVSAVTGENVTAEQLGGAQTHTSKSGVAHFRAANEAACFAELKRLLDFLPDNNLSDAPVRPSADELTRLIPEFDEMMPDSASRAYDIKGVLTRLVDGGDFLEVQPDFAKNIVIGFGRMNGGTVGFIANQPNHLAGSLDVDSSDKAARFVRFCDSFNIPIVTLTDVPAFLPGVGQEHSGIIRHGAKLLYAFAEATVPKINVILRKAYGGAYIAMNSKHLGADLVFAWPSAEIAVMGPDGAANIIFRKEIADAADPVATRAEKIAEYTEKFSSPYVAAARGYVDDVIVPSETRPRLISALEMLASKRETRPSKKHGNIPL